MTRTLRVLAVAGGLVAWLGGCTVPVEFDLVILGGTVYDGGPDPATQVQQVDVGIRGDRITELGDLSGRRVSRIIDATGLAVAPGFIDTDGRSGLALLADGAAESHVRQGITTEILSGPDVPAFWAGTPAQLDALARYGVAFDWDGPAAYFDRLETRGTAINAGVLVPVGAAREAVMGEASGAPTAAQLAAMVAYVRQAMAAGALGVSSTPSAPREQEVTRAEVVAVAREAGRTGGVLVARQRAGLAPDAAVAELTAIAAEADVPLVVAGLAAPGADTPNLGGELNRALVEPRAGGLRTSSTATLPSNVDDEVAEDTFRAILRGGTGSIGTASAAERWTGGEADSSAYATFPGFFQRYVRDESVLEWREAIRRTTSFAAGQFGVPDRGQLREGNFADVVIFDPMRIGAPAAGAAAPYPTGIAYVIVNGVVTVNPSGPTGSRAGRRVTDGGSADGP